MPHYIDQAGGLHFIDHEKFEFLLPPNSVPISDEEAAARRAPALSDVKKAKWAAIKAERDRRFQTGGYQVDGKWFHSDAFSRVQQLSLLLLGANIPAGTHWKTMDGTTVVMTPELAGKILAAAIASDTAIFTAAMNHKAAMESSANPNDYDFRTGWPPMYEEQTSGAPDGHHRR